MYEAIAYIFLLLISCYGLIKLLAIHVVDFEYLKLYHCNISMYFLYAKVTQLNLHMSREPNEASQIFLLVLLMCQLGLASSPRRDGDRLHLVLYACVQTFDVMFLGKNFCHLNRP